MSQRRILVIGSQCANLNFLSFLPEVANHLYQVMTDSTLGACIPALPMTGLLIDPSVDETYNAVSEAYKAASEVRATLFIAYIGHGSMLMDDFYLLPSDATEPPSGRTAVNIVQHIKELAAAHGSVDGLGLLIDTCFSGGASSAAADSWIRKLNGSMRFEILTSAGYTASWDGCFSRTLVSLISRGVSSLPAEYLQCHDLRKIIASSCQSQEPQNPSFNRDDTLWLARNSATMPEAWAFTEQAATIRSLTLGFHPPGQLVQIAARIEIDRCVALIGLPGTGKSTIAAALAWPAVSNGIVLPGFIHAIAFINEVTSAQDLAQTLYTQLSKSLSGFVEAHRKLRGTQTSAELQRMGALDREVLMPLKLLKPMRVRLVIDALDRLSVGATRAVTEALQSLAGFDSIRLLITARPETTLLKNMQVVLISMPADEEIADYLKMRGVVATRIIEIVNAAKNNWLVAKVFADLLIENPTVSLDFAQITLGDIYDTMLCSGGITVENSLLQTLAVLAASGEGPALPLSLLCGASDALGFDSSSTAVRNRLVLLKGLAIRNAGGTEDEHAGLFHQTLVDHVRVRLSEQYLLAHQAILVALSHVAPPIAGETANSSYAYKYAFAREAEHFWAVKETEKALKSLQTRLSAYPRDNLQRALQWENRFRQAFGDDHPSTFQLRSEAAFENAAAGHIAKAEQLFSSLLRDIERVDGNNSIHRLTPQHNLAVIAWDKGNRALAFSQMKSVLDERSRRHGQDHTDSLMSMSVLITWMHLSGQSVQAIAMGRKLLELRVAKFGAHHIDTLATRNNICMMLASLGQPAAALQETQSLLPQLKAVLGSEHPYVLRCQANIAGLLLQLNQHEKSLTAFEELLPVQGKVLSEDHDDYFKSQLSIAMIRALRGDCSQQLKVVEKCLAKSLLNRQPDHPLVLSLRLGVVELSAQTDPELAFIKLKNLLPLLETTLGNMDPETVAAKMFLAQLAYPKDSAYAIKIMNNVYAENNEAFGQEHPVTKLAKSMLSAWQK